MNQKKTLSVKEVKKIASLARLELTEYELTLFQKQLSSILNFVNRLRSMNTKGVISTSQVTGLENVFREDKVCPSLPQTAVLKNAKETYKEFIKIKAILEI